MPITRSTWTDDDGTGTLGTLINNSQLQTVYNNIDAAVWDAAQLANVSSAPTPKLRGFTNLSAVPNAGAPLTKLNVTTDFASFVNPNSPYVGMLKYLHGTTYTIDTGVSGPAANGRDQSSVFATPNWIYFYLMNDSTGVNPVAGICSLSAPPTGPTLLSGYDEWDYVCSRYWASSNLVAATTVGAETYYNARPTASLNAGSSITEVSLSLSTVVSPIAKFALIEYDFTGNAAGTSSTAHIRFVSGSEFYIINVNPGVASDQDCAQVKTPFSVAQTIYYKTDGSGTLGTLSLWVNGYSEPNGAC